MFRRVRGSRAGVCFGVCGGLTAAVAASSSNWTSSAEHHNNDHNIDHNIDHNHHNKHIKSNNTEDRNEDELVRVVCLFRHGARTPIFNSFPGMKDEFHWDVNEFRLAGHEQVPEVSVVSYEDRLSPVVVTKPYLSKVLPGGCLVGELTRAGRQHGLRLGEFLRTRYVTELKFLPTTFSAQDIFVRSTNYPRTVETARAVLYGLYGQSITQPVTIFARSDEHETMYPNLKKCQRIRELFSANMRMFRQLSQIDTARGVIASKLGCQPEDIDFVKIHDLITAIKIHNKNLPLVIDQSLEIQVTQIAALTGQHLFGRFHDSPHPETITLAAGPLVRDLCNFLDQFDTQPQQSSSAPTPTPLTAPHVTTGNSTDQSDQIDEIKQIMVDDKQQARDQSINGGENQNHARLVLLSGHDISLMPLRYAIDTFPHPWPAYCSHVIFELWQNKSTNARSVRIFFDGQPISLKHNDTPVPSSIALPDFLEFFKNFQSVESLPSHVCDPVVLKTSKAHSGIFHTKEDD